MNVTIQLWKPFRCICQSKTSLYAAVPFFIDLSQFAVMWNNNSNYNSWSDYLLLVAAAAGAINLGNFGPASRVDRFKSQVAS